MLTLTPAQLNAGHGQGATALRLAPDPDNPPLTTLPPALFELADTLEALEISGHALTTLPPQLARLQKLRVLFASFNQLSAVPPVLGDLPALSQLGLRGNRIAQFDDAAVPPRLRWLTLTDNALTQLPSALGHAPLLEKVGLAGNQLASLPESLAQAPRLALLRLSANALPALPGWLSQMPSLAWLGWGGNPVDRGFARPVAQPRQIAWGELTLGALLGHGASGHIHQALWQPPGAAAQPVAVKLFKGALTSDGWPEEEMAACLAAAGHPQVMGALGRIQGHPQGGQGLVMPLLPAGWRVLGTTPSPASCSRDVYPEGFALDGPVALRIAADVAAAAAHLRQRGLQHGDLYAHNTLWDGCQGRAMLSDFGAACFVPPGADAHGLERVEVRALGLLLEELWAHSAQPVPADLQALQAACVQPQVAQRPALAEVVFELAAAAGGG